MEISLGAEAHSNGIYDAVKDVVPIILAGLALAVSVNVASNSSRDRRVNFICEVDKMMIETPELWAMYDNHYLSSKALKEDLQLAGKIDALCYYILNNLEIAYKANHWYSPQRNAWRKAWRNYLKELYTNSTRFKVAVDYSVKNELYSINFLTFLKSLDSFTKK